jgi:glycerol-3-phosphate dehydrogenase
MTAEAGPPYDLLVIGGGINGAAVACDAAGRGLSVALVEMRDFAEGTSSRSSKLVHGGLRYLESYDFRLVREALLEREILMAKAPHLVWPLRFVLPHVDGQRPRWMIRLGLFIYDHLAPRKRLAPSESIDFARHPAGAALKPEFRRGFAYSDCRCDDARLVIANVLGAQRHGAAIHARHRFVAARRQQSLWQIDLEDCLSRRAITVRARALVNAAGPWVIAVGETIRGVATSRTLRMVRGSHIVVPRRWSEEHGYFLQTTEGRLMEIFPYERDFTFIGTTDEPWDEAPEKVRVSGQEIDYMIAQVNRFLRTPIARSDVVWSFSGVRPLFEVGGARDHDLSTLTRDYAFEIDHLNGAAPALTIFGGKLTTHRRMAEHAVSQLGRFLKTLRPGRTATEPLPGGDFGPGGMDSFAAALRREYAWLPASLLSRYVSTYGTRTRELLEGAREADDLGACLGSDLHEREIDFLMRTEWAQSAEDIVWRRTKLGLRLTQSQIDAIAAYADAASGRGAACDAAVTAPR